MPAEDAEAIAGDLEETLNVTILPRHGTGWAAFWYWRQVFIAILNSFIRETWGHKYNSALALVAGWSSLGLIWVLLEAISAQPFAWGRHACTFFWCIAGTGSGSVVGLLTRDRKSPMICFYATSVALFLTCIGRLNLMRRFTGSTPSL